MANETGSFTIKVNQAKKSVDMVIRGSFTPQKAVEFVNDYQTKVTSVEAKDFTLKLDCSDLNVVTPAMIPDLENCYRMYGSSGFGKVLFEIKKNPIIKMQLSRIARTTGLTNVEIVEIA